MPGGNLLTMVRAVEALCDGNAVSFTVSETDGVLQWRASCGERSAVADTPDGAAAALLDLVAAAVG
jgi:hypothetical protein